MFVIAESICRLTIRRKSSISLRQQPVDSQPAAEDNVPSSANWQRFLALKRRFKPFLGVDSRLISAMNEAL